MVYVEVTARRAGEACADFYWYLPVGEGRFVQYRFAYVSRPANPALGYEGGVNDPANSLLHRIREAYVGRLSEGRFTPEYRILQGGEVGFALKEEGAGDFVGGFHGDEVASAACLEGDGTPISLTEPSFAGYTALSFTQKSLIARCNTPTTPLCLHNQRYTAQGSELALAHRVEFLCDAHRLVAAYMPMLTVERRDPDNTERILTDRLAFYDREDGALLATLDTTPYGTTPPEGLSSSLLHGTPAAAVVATGRESGVTVRAGLRLPVGSPLAGAVRASVWIRYGGDLDSKVYFDVGGGTAPRRGTVWETEAYYDIAVK